MILFLANLVPVELVAQFLWAAGCASTLCCQGEVLSELWRYPYKLYGGRPSENHRLMTGLGV